VLDVPIGNTWPDGTDIAEIRQQAIEAGLRRLSEIVSTVIDHPRIVGEPKVTIVLVEDL
jgi:hypothetical protein